MHISEIENKIIEKLKEEISDLHIEGFPDKPQNFNLIHPKGAILIHYQGGNYSSSKSTSSIVQEKKLEFVLTIITKNLRSNEGAYTYLDKVKEILTGHKIDGCSKMYPIKENFLSEDAGLWQYSISFSMTIQNIERTQ